MTLLSMFFVSVASLAIPPLPSHLKDVVIAYDVQASTGGVFQELYCEVGTNEAGGFVFQSFALDSQHPQWTNNSSGAIADSKPYSDFLASVNEWKTTVRTGHSDVDEYMEARTALGQMIPVYGVGKRTVTGSDPATVEALKNTLQDVCF